MARLFNVLNVSIHCKTIFISRQNNYYSVPDSACVVTRGHFLGVDLAFHFLVASFSRELFIFGRSENRSECVVDVHTRLQLIHAA